MANPKASMREMVPTSEKCTLDPHIHSRGGGGVETGGDPCGRPRLSSIPCYRPYPLSAWCCCLELRWALGKQRLSLEWPCTCVMPFYNNGHARAKDVRHYPAIDHGQRLPTICNYEADLLILLVIHDRSSLHDAGHAY